MAINHTSKTLTAEPETRNQVPSGAEELGNHLVPPIRRQQIPRQCVCVRKRGREREREIERDRERSREIERERRLGVSSAHTQYAASRYLDLHRASECVGACLCVFEPRLTPPHFEPSLNALSLRSDVKSSTEIISLHTKSQVELRGKEGKAIEPQPKL